MASYRMTKRLDWRSWVTPKLLEAKPIHRWYVFPHSFTDELVKALIAEWELDSSDTIVDPFAGAGTAVLAAKELGIPAQGFDLSPLSVLATQVKVAVSIHSVRLRPAFQATSGLPGLRGWARRRRM